MEDLSKDVVKEVIKVCYEETYEQNSRIKHVYYEHADSSETLEIKCTA